MIFSLLVPPRQKCIRIKSMRLLLRLPLWGRLLMEPIRQQVAVLAESIHGGAASRARQDPLFPRDASEISGGDVHPFQSAPFAKSKRQNDRKAPTIEYSCMII